MSDKHRKARKHSRRYRESLWIKLYHRFTAIGRCHWCQKKIRFSESVFDHDPPLALGGNASRGVISCKSCDADRSAELSKSMNLIQRFETVREEGKGLKKAWEKEIGYGTT